jgi:hypothetical protein
VAELVAMELEPLPPSKLCQPRRYTFLLVARVQPVAEQQEVITVEEQLALDITMKVPVVEQQTFVPAHS